MKRDIYGNPRGIKIITVSGACSGVGKTTAVENLLSGGLTGWSALKVTVATDGSCPTGRNCGACHNLRSNFSLINSRKIIEEAGTDTHRFKKAGAGKVLWLISRPENLKEGLGKAMARFKGTRGLIIEGTSVLKFLEPNFAIFVRRKNSLLKDSAKAALRKADLILTNPKEA